MCTYWPEFAQQGKEKVTVRQLLSHQAGLVALDAYVNKSICSPTASPAPLAIQGQVGPLDGPTPRPGWSMPMLQTERDSIKEMIPGTWRYGMHFTG